jgi:hypothetical protein
MHPAPTLSKSLTQKLFDACVVRSWWMHLFLIACFWLYFQGMKKKECTMLELKDRIVLLEQERQVSLEKQEDLLLELHSQNDPAWIEMTLMKQLGVVPEGHMKVYFKKEE